MPVSLSVDPVPPSQIITSTGADSVSDADSLLGQAKGLEDQTDAQIAMAKTENCYEAAVTEAVEQKQDQVEQIEDRLDAMVAGAESRLQQVQSHPPGMFARQTTRDRWQAQVAMAQNNLQRIMARLDNVREIRDEIVDGRPKIEQMAVAKVKHEQPDLVAEFEATQVARRLHLERELEARRRKEAEALRVAPPERRRGVSLTRGLSHNRDA